MAPAAAAPVVSKERRTDTSSLRASASSRTSECVPADSIPELTSAALFLSSCPGAQRLSRNCDPDLFLKLQSIMNWH